MTGIPTGKNFKVWGFRGSRIGDSIMASPLMAWCRERWPECYLHWQVARRHVSSVPIWYGHKLIDQIVVSDCEEVMGPRDHAIASTCHIRFNVMPNHPDGDRNWATRFNIWEETWRMAGLPIEEYRALSPYDQRCHLTQWFAVDRDNLKGFIAIWPSSNYSVKQAWHSRFPSRCWTISLVNRLILEGYKVIQCGHPNDYADEGGALEGVVQARHLPFDQQVMLSLGCDTIIGTDSGSTLLLASYESVPTIQLLTDHMPGGMMDMAFASNSPTNKPLFGRGSADNIDIEEVIKAVKEIV